MWDFGCFNPKTVVPSNSMAKEIFIFGMLQMFFLLLTMLERDLVKFFRFGFYEEKIVASKRKG
jgi:hypothetical protein